MDTITWEGYNFNNEKFKWIVNEEMLPESFLWPDPRNKILKEKILDVFESLFLKFSIAQIVDPEGITLQDEDFRKSAVIAWIIIEDVNNNVSDGCILTDEIYQTCDCSYTITEYDFAIRFLVSLRVFIHKLAKQRVELHSAGGKASKLYPKIAKFFVIPSILSSGNTIYQSTLSIPNIRRNISTLLNRMYIYSMVDHLKNNTHYEISDVNGTISSEFGKEAITCIRNDNGDEFFTAWLRACDKEQVTCNKITEEHFLAPERLLHLTQIKREQKTANQRIESVKLMIEGLFENIGSENITNYLYEHIPGLNNIIPRININPYSPLNKFLNRMGISAASEQLQTVTTTPGQEYCDNLLGRKLAKDVSGLITACGISFLLQIVSHWVRNKCQEYAGRVYSVVKFGYGLKTEDDIIRKMKELPRVPGVWLEQPYIESLRTNPSTKDSLQKTMYNQDKKDETAFNQYKEFSDVTEDIVSYMSTIITFIIIIATVSENTSGLHWENENLHHLHIGIHMVRTILNFPYYAVEPVAKKLLDKMFPAIAEIVFKYL